MSVTIKQRNEKWRLLIENEEWEYPDRATMEIDLKEILDMKESNAVGVGKKYEKEKQ